MRHGWFIFGIAVLLLLQRSAQAHLVTTGLGPVYDGIGHFCLAPDDSIPVVALALLAVSLLPACGTSNKLAEPITQGQRVFTCGHSFHVWVPDILADLCKKAGIQGHTQVGISSIGGSQIIQHWNVPDDQNTAKKALKTGNVDVLTLSPIFLPDPGIENFTRLGLEYNKDIRVLVLCILLR